jgi:predicted PurR-regulated permease PerM
VKLLGLDAKAARYSWTAVFVFGVIWLLYLIRDTVFIFVVALLFAYLLWPLVNLLERRLPGRSKVPALTVVYLALVGILIVVGIVVGSHVVQEANALAAKVPEVLSKLHAPSKSPTLSGISRQSVVVSTIEHQLANHSQEIVAILPKAALGVIARAGSLIFVVLVPILSFFFLKDGREMRDSILGFVAEGPKRKTAERIAADLHVLLALYMRALVILGAVAAVCYGVCFSLMHVPYAALLATMAFFLEFIPMVGPFVGGVIVLLVAGVSGSGHLLAIFVFLVVFRTFQDYVVSPHLMSAEMKLHPLLVIFGILAGASVAGIPGSFLSVPVLATLRIVYRQWQIRTHPPLPSEQRPPPTGEQKLYRS